MAKSFACRAAVWQLVALPPESRAITQTVFSWITSGDLNVAFGLRLDPLSAVMILVVTGIGSLIHIYSTAYMHEEPDPEYARYFSYLNLFAAFMLAGARLELPRDVRRLKASACARISQWLLVRAVRVRCGKKAFIVNRIGDFGFILGVLLAYTRFRTIDFRKSRGRRSRAPDAAFGVVSAITLLLFVGATGKSAQIPRRLAAGRDGRSDPVSA